MSVSISEAGVVKKKNIITYSVLPSATSYLPEVITHIYLLAEKLVQTLPYCS